MKCSTEEPPLEVTEDCWVPPHLLQSFVACNLGSHSFHADASSLPYCARFSIHWFQSKELILGRMQHDMSFVAHSCCLTSALKSHNIGSQCRPFGKPHDLKIYSV
jgi:hypothetical protein